MLSQQLDPAFIFLSSDTIQNLAVEQAVAKAAIPTVYAGGGVAIFDKKNPWIFHIRPPDNMACEATGEALVTQMKAADVGILQVQDDYGAASANAFEAVLGRTNVKVVGREIYGACDYDFSAQLLSLKNKGAQALVAISYVRDGALVLNSGGPWASPPRSSATRRSAIPPCWTWSPPADVDGIYSIMDAVIGEARSPASGAYAAKLLDRFKMRADPFGSCSYDAAMILAEGLRKVGTDKAKLRDYFAAAKRYDGVTPTYTHIVLITAASMAREISGSSPS